MTSSHVPLHLPLIAVGQFQNPPPSSEPPEKTPTLFGFPEAVEDGKLLVGRIYSTKQARPDAMGTVKDAWNQTIELCIRDE